MPKYLVVWLAIGMSLDLLFLCECYMIESGMVGQVIKANYNRAASFGGKRTSIIITCVCGLGFPPYVLAGLVFFAYRVKQERTRLREYGRL
jgi:hypothetical protein